MSENVVRPGRLSLHGSEVFILTTPEEPHLNAVTLEVGVDGLVHAVAVPDELEDAPE